MKRLFLLVVFVVSIVTTCLASGTQTIQSVTKKEVIDHLVTIISTRCPGLILESVNEYGVVFVGTLPMKNVFGQQVGSQQNKLTFTAIENNSDVILSVNEIATGYNAFGGTQTQVINDFAYHQMLVNDVRKYFNDCYLFGYYLDTSKARKGGYLISGIKPGYSFQDNGIRVGDILLMINGKKLKKSKEYLLGTAFDEFRPNECTFTIMRDGKKKDFTMKSKLHKAEFVRKNIEQM